MNMEAIIIIGSCSGTFSNNSVTKEFEGKMLVSARPDGAIIVHNLNNGVRPTCYLDHAEVSIAKDTAGAEIELTATTEQGDTLTLSFSDVIAMQGIESSEAQSLAMASLKCVFDCGGQYGRTTIARILTGSVSKKVLTIPFPFNKLNQYGTAKSASMKEILALIDWLIEEGYLAYAEDSEFPVLVVTAKGLDIIAGDDELNPE